MKNIILTITLTLISMNSFAGLNMTCYQSFMNEYNGESGYSKDDMRGVKSLTMLDCTDAKGDDYSMLIRGVGIGYKVSAAADYAISCPTVNRRKLIRRGEVSLGSVKVSASLYFGVDALVAINHKGGLCAMTGVDLGLGVAASLGHMKIYKGSTHDNHEKFEEYYRNYPY
jgi:hypothetical protein